MIRTAAFAAVAAAAALALAVPAAAQPAPKAARQCFNQRDILNVAAQDDYTINLRIRPTDVYQAKTVIGCPDVGLGAAVAYRSFSSRICTAADMTFVTRGPFSARDCPLDSLRKLNPDEVAALPKRGRP